jgi:hypothetical protein
MHYIRYTLYKLNYFCGIVKQYPLNTKENLEQMTPDHVLRQAYHYNPAEACDLTNSWKKLLASEQDLGPIHVTIEEHEEEQNYWINGALFILYVLSIRFRMCWRCV